MTQRAAFFPDDARAAGPRSRFALLWLILALVFQGFATQTHVHFGNERSVVAGGLSVAAAEGDRQSPTAPPCQLCEEKALFGAYLLAGPAILVAPHVIAFYYAASALPPFARRASSHSWQSRAPPLPFV